MWSIYNCITVEHDLRLVFLAALICLFASASAVSLLARSRDAGPQRRALWILFAGVVAACGIWATHFVAMLAFHPDEPMAYATTTTLVSFAVAIVVSCMGFYIAAYVRPAGIGGAIVGLAIGSMHYVGMAALSVEGYLLWDRTYVAWSIVLGIVLSAAAFQVLASASSKITGQICGTLLLVLAICSLHFTGMTALNITYDPAVRIAEGIVQSNAVAIAVSAVTFFIVALAFVGAAVDSHLAERSVKEAARLRAHVVELEETKQKLETISRKLLVALNAASSADQAKSQFLATMSHELRTPLNAILGFSEIMASETFGPLGNARYSDYMNDILKSGKHLLALINDVLDFTRADAGQLHLFEEDIDVVEAIDDSVRMIESQAATGGVSLTFRIDDALPHMRADHRRVRQVLLNLLSNAVKFTPAGGSVLISATAADGPLVVKISDTGIGIAAKDVAVAMERFGQIDSDLSRKYEGTGLGLPLSKCLMEHHGGTLELESEPGRGTVATITFPQERIVGRANDIGMPGTLAFG